MAPHGLILEAAFDPETLDVLGRAYAAARSRLGDAAPPALEVVAKRIILAAQDGERDPEMLAAFALRGLDGAR
jgi:hypothetical protein